MTTKTSKTGNTKMKTVKKAVKTTMKVTTKITKTKNAKTLEEAIECLGTKSDPKVAFYFPNETTASQRNAIFRALCFYIARGPRAESLNYEAVVAGLNPHAALLANGSALEPFVYRISSGKQLGNFLWFLQQHKNIIWGGHAPVEPRLFLSIEDSAYFSISM